MPDQGEAANRFAGQGPVLLDIGGSVGAVVITMPAELIGQEVQVHAVGPHSHGSHGEHGYGTHQHGSDAQHTHEPHVGVVNRPAFGSGGPLRATAVFPELEEGEYEFNLRPSSPPQLRVTVLGGVVTEASWPV